MTPESVGATVNGLTIVAAIVTMLLAVLAAVRTRHVKQYGGRRRKQLHRLTAELAAAPVGGPRAVRWLDFSSLGKLDIADVLWEHGFVLDGQDPFADGWPLRVRRAGGADAAPTGREDLLAAELRAAEDRGDRKLLLDLVPYQDLDRGQVGRVAEAFGWTVGRVEMRGGPLLRLSRPLVDA